MPLINKPSSCSGCPLYGSGKGWVGQEGEGSNGVLIVLEAAGADEEAQGRPTVGKAGLYLWSSLAKVGLKREDFRIHNVLSCRPPENKLAGMPYEQACIKHCAPNLDRTIEIHRAQSLENGKTPVIVVLGKIAMKRVLDVNDKHPIMREDYIAYPFWSEKYQSWVLCADHPSYLMRGNSHLLSTLQFVVKRAVEIAEHGLQIDNPPYLLNPDPVAFNQWADEYLKVGADHYLSFDIETPHKQGESEDELEEGEDLDYTILRVSFCYKPGDSVSVPWRAEYLPTIRKLFASPFPKVGWNNHGFDDARISVQMPIHGDSLDAMQAWHVLNSAMPKGLGFVTPYYWQNTQMWKHLSSAQPAFYNAKDADAALRNWLGIKRDLEAQGLWEVFQKHVIEVNRIFAFMSQQGVEIDLELRAEYERVVKEELQKVEAQIEAAVPHYAREQKVYKKAPKDMEGVLTRTIKGEEKVCLNCGLVNPKKPHFRVLKKKLNPCSGSMAVPVAANVTEYYKLLPFKISKTSLLRYQNALRHKPIIDPKKGQITFDEKAILRLSKLYPHDPLYPLVLEQRALAKLKGTYIGETQLDGTVRGGLPNVDGVIHTRFTQNPETLRSASQNPNLQNLPRSGVQVGS